ncbi:MAG: aldo/keto reductase, partial [Gemmatimonadota bacterium]
SRLFSRVGDREVPDWARPFAESWAQFFIKFAAAHPAVTTVTPATSQARHMVDNLGAASGRLPNPEEVKRMVALVEALPSGG